MHTEPPTIFVFLDLNCVIEISRIVGIDRDDEFFAQIFTSLELSWIDFIGNPLCLVQNLFRKFCWQMKFPDDREHVDARRGCRPEDFDDFAFGIDVARLPGVEANHDFVANSSGGLRPPIFF